MLNGEKLYVIENGVTREYTDAEYAQAQADLQAGLAGLPAQIRLRRDNLLSQCDWTQASDSPLSADKKTAWANYRQALRNIPQSASFPSNVIFPTPPQ